MKFNKYFSSKMRCSYVLDSLRRCTRSVENGSFCYQHMEARKLPSLDSTFAEKYSKIAEFLSDDKAFLQSLPKGIDANRIILNKMKKTSVPWPLTFLVGEKMHTFKSLDKAREFILEKYKVDIFPLLISSIRKYGTTNKETSPKMSNKEDLPYRFRYYLGKSHYPDTPAVSTANINYRFEDEDDPDMDMLDDGQLQEINSYIQSISLLPLILKRGDLIFNSEYGGYRNTGVLIWDGKKAIELDRELDDYGSIPSQFKTLTEFPFGYFYDTESSMGIDHNYIQWMNLSSYAEQAKDNFDGHNSFIDVKEIVDGKERTIRIYLTIFMYDNDREVPTTGDDYKEFLLNNEYLQTMKYKDGKREIWVERSVRTRPERVQYDDEDDPRLYDEED